MSVHFSQDGCVPGVTRFGVLDRVEDGYCYGRLDNGGMFCCDHEYVFFESDGINRDIDEFKSWIMATPEYTTLLANYGPNLFNRDMGEFCILPIRLSYRLWTALNSSFKA